jgi:signal transduction histidine kinase
LLSRIRFHRVAALLFVATYFSLASYTLYTWGILLHTGLLLFALVIIISGILVGTKFAIAVLGGTSLTLLVLAHFTAKHTIQPSLDWTTQPGGYDDAVTFIIILSIITMVSWLSNRETERSLARARHSERALTEQRDLLEVMVHERTRELEKTQQEELLRLYQFAELGKLTSSLIHDLVNPLTTVSLSLAKMKNTEKSQLAKRALDGAKRMESFIGMARKQINNQRTYTFFDVADIITQVINDVEIRAKKQKVIIDFVPKSTIEIYGDPIKFHELIINLMTNAIDSYHTVKPNPRFTPFVALELYREAESAVITIRDHGHGIPEEIAGKVFDPFFSTKPEDKGMGLGLAIVKDIIDKEFAGTITVSSRIHEGTSILIRIPLRH